MNESKVLVISMASATVVINLPDHHFRHVWPQKGAKALIDKDLLREAIYEPSVEYLLKNGMLYIDDLEFKRELGLEPYDAEAATIVALDEKYLVRLLKTMPTFELTKALQGLTHEQRQEFIVYAVDHYNELQMDRIGIINKECNVDLLKMIQLRKAEQEEE